MQAGDPSDASDPVTVFRTASAQSTFEAQNVQAMLEAEGIPTELVGDTRLPNLAFEVRVSQADVERATQLIAEAEALGPAGADEAERQTE